MMFAFQTNILEKREPYFPKPYVISRNNRSEVDLEELRSVLDFLTDAIREERIRVAEIHSYIETNAHEDLVPSVWPEAV